VAAATEVQRRAVQVVQHMCEEPRHRPRYGEKPHSALYRVGFVEAHTPAGILTHRRSVSTHRRAPGVWPCRRPVGKERLTGPVWRWLARPKNVRLEWNVARWLAPCRRSRRPLG
jgi:hypothetical protein